MLLLVIPLEKITMRAGDGLELEGFLSGPRAGRAIIFIHGWKDNAFTAPFVKPMAERAAEAGIAFLAFNNRGAGKKGETERFADCILDIRAAVEFMAGRGHERIFLVGHSTGCQKAAYYVHKEKDDRIGGIAFIEPTDDAALARRELGEKYGKAVGLAREMAASGERNRMMPEWSLVGGEASADRYLSMFSGEEAEGGMFDFSGKLELISGLSGNILFVYGSDTEYTHEPREKLDKLMHRMEWCSTYLEEGAGHWFRGHEEALTSLVAEWAGEGEASA